MVAAVNWEAAGAVSTLLSTELNSLANNAISAASAEFNNEANLDVLAWFELTVDHTVNPSATPPVHDLYMTRALDGTNYESAPVTGGSGQGHLYVGSFRVLANTNVQRIVIGPFLLPPMKLKFYVDNRCGQAMEASGNTLKISTNNLESQ